MPTHDFQLPLRAILHKDFAQTPAAFAEAPKFRAVTLDCDMAGIASGAIFLCAADYVTGALLINQFVCPKETITQMRSSIHGISKATLDDAVSQGLALSGWEGTGLREGTGESTAKEGGGGGTAARREEKKEIQQGSWREGWGWCRNQQSFLFY